MTSWERARDLVGSCMRKIPRDRIREYRGQFLFNSKFEPFSYRTIVHDDSPQGPTTVSACFVSDAEPAEDTFLALSVGVEGRSFFLFEHCFFDVPVAFNPIYPTSHSRWDRAGTGGRAVLTFFRVDISQDAFVNFEGPELRATLKEGDHALFSDIPQSVLRVESVLGLPVVREINLEERASAILAHSRLMEFAKICKAVQN